ncbi:MAG: MgtC/SapB family protein [Nitrospinota bacterium]
MENYWELILKLALAGGLGGVIGFEREMTQQPAGLRTHIILCSGSALIMMVSIFMGQTHGADPSRIAAQVVSGIGFLGAGAIIRLGVSIKGLTTAASLWTTAGIGLAVGAGFYLGALLITAIIIIALVLLKGLERAYAVGKGAVTVFIGARDVPGILGRMEEVVSRHRGTLRDLQITRRHGERAMEVRLSMEVPEHFDRPSFTRELNELEGVTEFDIR